MEVGEVGRTRVYIKRHWLPENRKVKGEDIPARNVKKYRGRRDIAPPFL